MRKSIILIIALMIYGFLLGEGWAAKISIGGTHSRSQIQATAALWAAVSFQTPTTAALTNAALTRAPSSA